MRERMLILMIKIQGGRVVDPQSKTDRICDVVIDGGNIIAMGDGGNWDGIETVIDARGKIVAPGLVDIHVHFRDPGFTYKEDIQTGSAAGARGGFTTVLCMANTKPLVDNPETLRSVLDEAKKSPIRVRTVAAVSKGFSGAELTDMAALQKLGAAGFSDDGIPIMDAGFLRRAMGVARDLGAVISLHEEDPSLISTAGVNDGAVSARFGLTGAPNVSESSMIARDCMLALDTGAKVHMQHVSCRESVGMIRLIKSLGADVTAEATPQHLSITEDAVLEWGSLAKLNPPLRKEVDRQAIIQGLKDGTIDIIATDHAPHSQEEKARELKAAPSGLTGLETALALCVTNLVHTGHLSLMQLLEKLTIAPARRYGFDTGYLRVGGPADLVIFDENETWTVGEFASKSNNSPFVGTQLQGKVMCTICGGNVVYSDGLK